MPSRVVIRNDPLACRSASRVEGEILIRSEPAAGDADAHHELPELALAALLQFGGAVAVVALVDPVEFEQRISFLVEGYGRVGEIAGDMTAELAALLLNRFGLREVLDRAHGGASAGETVAGKSVGRRGTSGDKRSQDQGQRIVGRELVDQLR